MNSISSKEFFERKSSMAFLLEFKDRENAARRGNAKLSVDLQDRPPLTFPFLVNDLGPVDS